MPALVFDDQQIEFVIDRVVDRTFRMNFSWDWPGGVAFYGVCEAYKATGKKEYLEQLKAWVDENMEDGLPKLSVNGVSIGHSLLTLYEVYEDERYIETAKEMAEFLTHDALRFGSGIFQHTVNSETYNISGAGVGRYDVHGRLLPASDRRAARPGGLFRGWFEAVSRP